jgi:hypothetical protein
MDKIFGKKTVEGISDRVTGGGTEGLLGKLSLTKGGGSLKLTGLGKISAGALASYFVGKGATPEEAKDLTGDVYRGEGIGFDQIRADLEKYKSGEFSQKQMFDKNYRFLTPRKFIAAEGGSPNMKMAEIPKGLTMEKAVRTFELSNGRKPKNMQEVIEFFKNRKLSAKGGIMNMPTGKMRKNSAGVMERDYREEGGFVPVGVKEKADDVPAMLSKNEFVMTADAVRGAGNGSIDKGAQKMYNTMKRLEGMVK